MRRLAVLTLFAALGCSRAGTLVAKTGHHRLTARDKPTGVTVVLTTGAWGGQPRGLDEELTVLHVLVANMGKDKVLLAPGDLEMRDLRGFRYDLLDPGASFQLADDADAGPVRPPGGAYDRRYDPNYDHGGQTRYGLIDTVGDIGRDALPWGVLEPGTQMRGYLYFERVTRTANGAKLTWRLTTPKHKPIVDLAFDLYVARPRT